MNLTAFFTWDKEYIHASQRLRIIHEMLEPNRSLPLEANKLALINSQHLAANRAVILPILWIPKQLILASYSRLHVSLLRKPFLETLAEALNQEDSSKT